jgi:hypothetical protein
VELDRQLRRVGLDEVDLDLAAAGQRARLLERGGREVDADHAGAAPRERDRIEADVALEVQHVEPRDRADGLAQPRRLGFSQRVRAGHQRLGVVVRVLPVDGRQRVPMGPVDAASGLAIHKGAREDIPARRRTGKADGFPRP